jgi:hypothetical protein
MKTFYLLLFSLFFNLTHAQVSFDPTYNLSNTPGATSDYHSVYSESGGNYYVVWGDNGNILFKRSTDMGESWSANQTLISSNNICGWPVVKADFNYVYVVCHQLAGDYEILFCASSDFGQTWGPVQIISGMDSGSLTPQLTVYGSNVFVTWEQKTSLINNIPEIYFIKSTDRGVNWSSPINLSNSPTLHSRWVQLESSNSVLYCAWLESPTYPQSDIYFSKSTDNGTSWTSPVNITNDARPQSRIYMTIYGNNHLYIASDDIITFNFDEIYLIKSTNGGLNWSTPLNITNNAGNSNTPCVMVFGDNIYFTWSDNSHSAPAYDNSDIFFKWSSNDGVTWQDSINLSANTESSSRPRICYGINGPIPFPWLDLTVVWYDYSTGNAEILARRGMQYLVPVELTSFEASVFNNDVTLNWTTTTEMNNQGFEIQRLKDSKIEKLKEWIKIGFVNGNGTSTEPKAYSFVDEKLSAGKYQYRLKQIDFDGSFEYSNIIEIDISLPEKFSLEQNYPNPFNPSTKIKFTIPYVTLSGVEGSFVTLKVFDVLGNEITTLVDEEKSAGSYEAEFKSTAGSNQLASGIYFYQLKAGDYLETKKMIMVK